MWILIAILLLIYIVILIDIYIFRFIKIETKHDRHLKDLILKNKGVNVDNKPVIPTKNTNKKTFNF